MISIHETFTKLKAKGQIAFMPFVPAGYPDMKTTALLLPALEAAGANMIEIGVPFSDPIADGPTIQEAFSAALDAGVKVSHVFECVASVRSKVSIPLFAMLSFSIVFRYGLEKFLTDAKKAGFDGLIIPDLPPPEAQKMCDQIKKAGLETVLLVAPTTSEQRRKTIGQLSSGFVYYLSVSGITGERTALPDDLRKGVTDMKQRTSTPVCVGFGISNASHLKQLQGVADGAIVGSAIVKKIKANAQNGTEKVVAEVAAYCRELLSLVR